MLRRSLLDRLLGRPCRCGRLDDTVANEDVPLNYDRELREFYLTDARGGKYAIYCCPSCGGRTPPSLRDQHFARIPDSELDRLFDMVHGLQSEDDVLQALGQPDEELEGGVISQQQNGEPGRTVLHRVLVYERLSDTADLQVSVFGSGKTEFAFAPKPLSKVDRPSLAELANQSLQTDG